MGSIMSFGLRIGWVDSMCVMPCVFISFEICGLAGLPVCLIKQFYIKTS